MSLVFDLAPELKAERLTGIGGSDAPKIMAGKWQELWLEKTGRSTPKKIMSDWSRALRAVTETLQLDWWEHRTGQKIIRREWPDNSVRSIEFPWMRATLDGMIEETGEPINAKHMSGWTKNLSTWMEEYSWQILHEIVVTAPATMRGWISLIKGETEPQPIPIDADPISLQQLIAAEREFWGFIERDESPDENYRPDAGVIEWDAMRKIDFTGNNIWADHAGIICDTIDDWKRCNAARDELKALVEPDVREAWGHGIIVTRNRGGALTIKEYDND